MEGGREGGTEGRRGKEERKRELSVSLGQSGVSMGTDKCCGLLHKGSCNERDDIPVRAKVEHRGLHWLGYPE